MIGPLCFHHKAIAELKEQPTQCQGQTNCLESLTLSAHVMYMEHYCQSAVTRMMTVRVYDLVSEKFKVGRMCMYLRYAQKCKW
jgi:hypothetical protein